VVLREALSNTDAAFAQLIRSDWVRSAEDVAAAIPHVDRPNRKDYQMNRRLNPTERDKLVKQYVAGASTYQLARQFGIHRHTVSKHLRTRGIVIRGGRQKMTPDVIAVAAQLHASGQSLAQIGLRLGIDATTVHKALKNAGVTMRDTHGRPV
jgi:DNA-binding CsgD family transcriptional regulator